MIRILKPLRVKLALILVLFVVLVVAAVYGHPVASAVITVLMICLGAYYDETFPFKWESKELSEYKEERDQLVGNYMTFNPAFRYYRAGNCKCNTCGLEYRDHPITRMPEKRFYGVELYVLCNTDRVKL